MAKIIYFLKSIGGAGRTPGSRWITVHPNGPGTTGQAVLVEPAAHGGLVVLGGMGGKLNHLRLRAVKSVSDYKQEAAKTAEDKKAQRKAQVAAEKEAGTYDAKQAARRDVQDQRKEAERQVIQAVAKKAGWDPKDLEFPADDYAHLSPQAQAKVEAQFHRQLLSKAKDVVRESRQRLLDDPEARAEARIGEVPLDSTDLEVLSVKDLDPTKPRAGLGFAPEYGKRAAAAGATPEQIEAEADDALTPEERIRKFKHSLGAAQVQKELEGIKVPPAPGADASLMSAKDALDLVREGKRLQLIERQARDAMAKIDDTPEPKAFVLEASDDDIDEAVKKSIEDDLRTASTRAFLAEVGKIAGGEPEETLGGHVAAGAFNSVNALSLAVGGQALVDRSVVDVLGVAGAAEVLARRLRQDLSPEDLAAVAAGAEDYHVNSYMGKSGEALSKAKELQEAAAAIDVSEEAQTGADLAVAQELNNRRRRAIVDAQRILGQAMGEMEASAALSVALKGGGSQDFEVSLGKTGVEDSVTQVRALGLKGGDYSLDRVAGQTWLKVTHDGMLRLSKPVSVEDLKAVRRNLSIIRGDKDEDGWLPEGVADRPDLGMDVPAGVADRMAIPWKPGPDLADSLRDYIGARAADGDAPQDIVADVQSADFYQKVGAGRADEYRKALDAVAPLLGPDGKMRRAEDLEPAFEALADAYVQKLGGDRKTLNKQKFEVGQQSVDALHRALSAVPEGKAAYKQIGDLDPDDQATLRKFFYANLAHEDDGAKVLREQLESLVGNEPQRKTTDMFGDEVDNPDWKDWASHKDKLSGDLNAASLTWGKYVKIMGGNERAYESVQDSIRSKVSEAFMDAHNRLTPGAPLKLGKRSLRNNLLHLDAVDPVARAERMKRDRALIDTLRERQKGKYASGSVTDKIEDAKELQAAFEQAQMGFFSSEDLSETGEGGHAPLAADERFTLGHKAERQIAGMMAAVGRNFEAGKPTKLWRVSMSGKYAPQQRAIKLIDANKRVVLAHGAGCVHGGTMLKCEVTGADRSVYDWWLSGNLPFVRCFDEKTSSVRVQQASDIFVKAFETMLNVKTAGGRSITVAAGHRFFTKRGWVHASNLNQSDEILSDGSTGVSANHDQLEKVTQAVRSRVFGASTDPEQRPVAPGSISIEECRHSSTVGAFFVEQLLDFHRSKRICCVADSHLTAACACSTSPDQTNSECGPEAHLAGAQRCCRRDKGSQSCCSGGSRQCSGQPHALSGNGQDTAPSSNGVEVCSHSNEHVDDIFLRQGHSHVCQSSYRQPIPHSALQIAPLADAWGYEILVACREFAGHLRRKTSEFIQFLGSRRSTSDADRLGWGESSVSLVPFFDQVASIEGIGRSFVFDMTIPVYHNYFCHGLLHHNSGKTNVMLGAHAHLSSRGKVKRSLMAVPSVVQGQFAGEALRLLQPGKFTVHAKPGASRDDRIAALRDAGNHVVVTTHQALRDDLVHLGAGHAGVSEEEMLTKLQGMTPVERRDWVSGVFKKEGIAFDMSAIDEAHDTLNRAGKENSGLANVLEAVGHHTPYHIYSSGEGGVKNDISEVFSSLQKMDPDRYADRGEFMRRYGPNTIAAKQGLQRELARWTFPSRIRPDIGRTKTTDTVPLTEGQNKALADVDAMAKRVAGAEKSGGVDIDAVRVLSPKSFDGVPETEHEEMARRLQKSGEILRQSAAQRVINTHEDNAKVAAGVKHVLARPGKQGVIFARNHAAVDLYRKALEKAGKKVVSVTGADTAAEKDAKRRLFNPEQGEPGADVLVASDAAAVGMNLQSGQYLIQHDTPATAKAQPLDAMVLTPSGWRMMGDINVGDLVITPSGDWAPVTGVFPQGKKEIFKVTMSDGASTPGAVLIIYG